ncbi:MAG TPA: lipoyl(octanoyl) transferase LipB [Candidatus Acidoferrum sp.]|nr:lipoyl(octanoyl) transferase LipB [Candidatus Acidoferrum sp.]
MNTCSIVHLGLVGWADVFALQQRVVAARKSGMMGDTLLICEHPHTITLGRNANLQHLLASENVLRQKSVELHHTNRGGDITYHGPGQLVGYPILNLAAIRRDVGWYMRMLEETMMRASAEYGVTAVREAGKTGIWVTGAAGVPPEKLAALGVHLSRWVTSHGFAYNVSTDLRYFGLIVPCGIAERTATSLEKLLGKSVDLADVAGRVARHLGAVLNLEMRVVPRVQFMGELERAEQSALLPRTAQEHMPNTSGAKLETVRSDA